MDTTWKTCGPCGQKIPYGGTYFACGTSSCQKSAFCSLDCWNAHIPLMKHKDAWAEERQAPQDADESPNLSTQHKSTEVLIVASKLKNYVKEQSGLNTSSNVMQRLSDIVRIQCDKAIRNAKNEGRKTVLDRDFTNPH